MQETGKGEQRRESRELTGIKNLHLALQPPQEAARGKEKIYDKKGMWILGHRRFRASAQSSAACLPLSPSLVSQAAACLKAPSLTPGPISFPSASICLSPRSGPAVSCTTSIGCEEIFHRTRKALVSQAGCWTEKSGELLLYGLLLALPPLPPSSLPPVTHTWQDSSTVLEKREWSPFQRSQRDPSSHVLLGLSKN